MPAAPTTIDSYLANIPAEHRAAINTLREVLRKNLDKGYEEAFLYGMPHIVVPHRVFPDGYHCDPSKPLPFAGMASRKSGISFYLMCVYLDPAERAWFEKAWAKTGKKLDMGKSCITFKKPEDMALEVIAEAVRRVPSKAYIAKYVSLRDGQASRKKAASKKPAAKKTATKKATSTRKTAGKQAAKKKSSKRA